jgi:hypothetical protein
MFDRYSENARRAVFLAREEASSLGSSCIETEHLLLGTIGSCDAELDENLKLKNLVDSLRASVTTNARQDFCSKSDTPLSNQSKRVLAYAAEEAMRLKSPGIDCGHLLLGILREPDSSASRFLLARDIDLPRTRQIIAILSRPHAADAGLYSPLPSGFAGSARRRYWIAAGTQMAPLIILAVGVVKSALAGRRLLFIGAVWFAVAFAWHLLGPSSFFWNLGRRNRAVAMTISYAFFFLYQLFMFGWFIPLAVGTYRVAIH